MIGDWNLNVDKREHSFHSRSVVNYWKVLCFGGCRGSFFLSLMGLKRWIHLGFFLCCRGRVRWRRCRWSQVSCYVWNTPPSRNTSLSTTPHCFTPSHPGRNNLFIIGLVVTEVETCIKPWRQGSKKKFRTFEGKISQKYLFYFLWETPGIVELWNHAAPPERDWGLLWRRNATTTTEEPLLVRHWNTDTHWTDIGLWTNNSYRDSHLNKGLKRPLNVFSTPDLYILWRHSRLSWISWFFIFLLVKYNFSENRNTEEKINTSL